MHLVLVQWLRARSIAESGIQTALTAVCNPNSDCQYRLHTFPYFTAPAVIPWVNERCNIRNNSTMGKKVMTPAAAIPA